MNLTCFLDSPSLNPQTNGSFLDIAAPVLTDKQFRLAHCSASGCAISAVAADETSLDKGIKPLLEQLASAEGISPRYDSNIMGYPISGDVRLSLLAPVQLPAACFTTVDSLLSDLGLRIKAIQRSLAADEDPENGMHVLAIICAGSIEDTASAKVALQAIANKHGIDLVLQDSASFDRDYRLVCFDMDSTLIKAEVIDELAKVHGVGDQVAGITIRAMRGELEFSSSLKERVALLNGLNAEVMRGIAENLPLMDGATRLCYRLGERGIKMAILSGGFTFFGQHLQEILGLDYMVANQLEIVDGACTGKHLGEIINAEAKAEHLLRICDELHIRASDAIAIGDGANDLKMIGTAGLGFAFHAKPLVREQAPHTVNQVGLDALLHLI